MSHVRHRLSPFAFARKHVSGGRAQIALFDQRRPGAFYPGAKGWAVLEALDGSRDLDGVRAVLARRYPALTKEELEAFVASAAAQGIVEGVADEPDDPASVRARASTEEEIPLAATIRTLPGFALACDGRGSCCRLYPSIVASPLEAANARSAMPDVLDAGEDEARAFFPERGSDRRSLSIALVDGACAYLQKDGGCGVHARRGEEQKPLGCRTYPLSHVFDGSAVREAPVVECACVIASGLDRASGVEAERTRAELDPRVVVERLPSRVLVSRASGRYAPVEEIRAWCDRALDRAPEDVPSALFAASRALGGGELAEAWPASAPLSEDERARVVACAAALGASASRRLEELAPSGLALANVVLQGISIACEIVATDLDALSVVSDALHASERFWLRGILFGLDLVHGRDESLADALFDRGFRVIVARAMAVAFSLADVTDPAVRYPIAVLGATVRGYGLATSP